MIQKSKTLPTKSGLKKTYFSIKITNTILKKGWHNPAILSQKIRLIMSKTLHHIVIVGGGAGGLELATQLGERFGRKKKPESHWLTKI